MIYSTGTISINGNTATGSGTNWTAPASQVRAGQTIIVMSNPVQLFQISSVNSATSMTVTPAASPALSGQKYGILVSDIISVDGLAQAMSQLIKEYDENIGAWETFASTSANQLVTVTINGTSLSIPAIGGLARKGANSDITELKGLTTALSMGQGGTGAKTAADARTNLGLGSAATLNYGANAGQVITNQKTYNFNNSDFVPRADGASPGVNIMALAFDGFYNKVLGADGPDTGIPSAAQNGTGYTYATCYNLNGANRTYLFVPYATSGNSGSLCWRGVFSGNATPLIFSRDSRNTTVDSNGFIKTASPIVKLFSDGKYEVNDESEGCVVTRQGLGEYLIEGCTGLNSDAAWGGVDGGFEIPTDRNKQPLIWLDYEVNADGSVLVKTYHRTNPGAPEFARNEIEGLSDGDPVDIPTDQFVSVRVQMPACSIWNQKQEEAIDAMRKFEPEEPTDPQ